MVAWLVSAGLRFGRLVVALAIGILGIGLVQLHGANVDVYPEFEPPAVQVQAEALGLSAQEVEQLITVPLEQDLLNGIPWLEHIRSESMPGLSAINLEFEPGTDLYEARQMVQERMTQAKALPNVGTPPMMVQPTSSTSRVAMIAMSSDTVTTMQMSVLARWQIRPRLMSIPGVANVSVWGLRDRQLQVQVDPDRLRSNDVTLTELIESTGNALWVSPLSFVEASTPGTGGFVETPNQRLGVQHIQPITTSDQLADVAVEGDHKTPLRIGDVASVREDHQPLIGDASVDGAPSLMLVVERFPDANTADVTRDVEAAMAAMAPGLSGIAVDPTIFRPATYLSTALGHLGVAGLVALIVLIAALAGLLLSWRVALIAAVAVPLSVTTAAYVLHLRGETLTTMTLLGLAAALVVVIDDAVGDVAEISQPAAGGRERTSGVGGEGRRRGETGSAAVRHRRGAAHPVSAVADGRGEWRLHQADRAQLRAGRGRIAARRAAGHPDPGGAVVGRPQAAGPGRSARCLGTPRLRPGGDPVARPSRARPRRRDPAAGGRGRDRLADRVRPGSADPSGSQRDGAVAGRTRAPP